MRLTYNWKIHFIFFFFYVVFWYSQNLCLIFDFSLRFLCFVSSQTIYAAGMGCVPGTFVSNTGCPRCPNGTFSDKHNVTKCSQCDRCFGKHNEIVKSCTSSSNTECSCQSGYYNGGFLFCLKCTQCKRGRGVVRNCTATSNTECGLCVKVRD